MIMQPLKKIVFLSDTHFKHDRIEVPECDFLVIPGDYTRVGYVSEIESFFKWLTEQTQAKYKIFIEGNHDMHADPFNCPTKRRFPFVAAFEDFQLILLNWRERFQEHNIYRLMNSGVELEGVKFWGSPYTIEFHGWGFNSTLDELEQNWKQVPPDVDVLLTHGPPLGHLDLCLDGHKAGDPWLLQKVLEIKPKYHVFGHIHEGYGSKVIGVEGEKQTTLINASVLDHNYMPTQQPLTFYI